MWDKLQKMLSSEEKDTQQIAAPSPTPTPSKPDYLDRLKMAESGGRADVKASTSSATGHHQFIESTWKAMTKKHNLDYTLEDRKDPIKSRKVAELYTEENRQAFKKVFGEEPTDTQLYAAHFLGTTGAKKFVSAKPFELATKVVDRDQVAANKSIFFDKATKKPRTVAEVYKLLKTKIGEE